MRPACCSALIARALCGTLALLVALAPAPATLADDDLGDFEEEMEEEGDSDDDYGDYDEDSGSIDAIFALLFSVVMGSAASVHYAQTREPGAPTLPYLRLENTYQPLVDADVQGYAVRAEAGWAFLAVAGEFVRYWEDDPSDQLDSWFVEGLWRFAPNPHLRLDLAAGARGFERNKRHQGPQGGVSVGIYPNRALGLEADLRWAEINQRTLSDYRGAVVLRHPDFPYLALRGGYRGILIGDEELHGPEAGLVITW